MTIGLTVNLAYSGEPSPENCLYFFLVHSFGFRYFHNEWNDHYDRVTVIMKEGRLGLSTLWSFRDHILLSEFLILQGNRARLFVWA